MPVPAVILANVASEGTCSPSSRRAMSFTGLPPPPVCQCQGLGHRGIHDDRAVAQVGRRKAALAEAAYVVRAGYRPDFKPAADPEAQILGGDLVDHHLAGATRPA